MKRIVAATLLIFLAAGPVGAQATSPATQPKDETTLVKRGDLPATIEFDGYFEPVESYEVRVRPRSYQGDLLVAAAAAHGISVKKGQPLLEVESTQLKKQVAVAENELATAQANLARAQADVQLGEAGDALAMKIQQNDLSNAEAALKWWEEVDGAHMMRTAELAVKTAGDNVEDQGDELDQLKKMYKSEELTNATADIVVKRALRALERAKIMQGMQSEKETKIKSFDYTVARQKLAFAIEQQKQALSELVAKQQQQSALRKTALASAQAAADKADTKLAELRGDLEAFAVTAPFDGVVFFGELNQGRWTNANLKSLRKDEKLQPGQVVMTLASPARLRLMLDVPETKLAFVTPQTEVRIIPASLPDAACSGVLGAPAPAGVPKDNGQVFLTPVSIDAIDPRLGPGHKAIARYDVQVRDVLLVPSSALARGRVKVKGADGASQWRDVVTGYSDGDLTEIRKGLAEGDTVLTKAAK